MAIEREFRIPVRELIDLASKYSEPLEKFLRFRARDQPDDQVWAWEISSADGEHAGICVTELGNLYCFKRRLVEREPMKAALITKKLWDSTDGPLTPWFEGQGYGYSDTTLT